MDRKKSAAAKPYVAVPWEQPGHRTSSSRYLCRRPSVRQVFDIIPRSSHFAERRLQEAEQIPEWLAPMIEKVEAYGGQAAKIKQVLCTEYDAGVGIGWHRDKPHFDQVFGLSLGSACKFRFRRKSGEKWERFTLGAEPRSLYVMTGESRHVWEHSIPPVEEPRYSITFRSMAS